MILAVNRTCVVLLGRIASVVVVVVVVCLCVVAERCVDVASKKLPREGESAGLRQPGMKETSMSKSDSGNA